MSTTVLIGTGISASAFSDQFKGDLEIHEKASRIGGRLCARNYQEYIIQYGAQYATFLAYIRKSHPNKSTP